MRWVVVLGGWQACPKGLPKDFQVTMMVTQCDLEWEQSD